MLAQKAWRMIRTLIFTYLVSGVLLTALAFALYKFRLPESQITLGISGVYILSCFMGGFMAGKAMRSRKFLWGLLTGILYFAFLLIMSFLQDRTITADAVMGDRYNAVVIYTISRDDGTALLPEGAEDAMLLVHGNGTDLSILGGTHGGSYFVVEDPAASSIQMVETRSSDVPLNDCTATAVFENLYQWDEETGEAVPIVEGKWKLKFEMAYEDSSITLGSGETFSQGGMTFTIDAVTISPVAYKVDYAVDREVVWSESGSGRQDPEDARQMEQYLENVEILLTKTDGTVIDLSNAGGSIGPEDGKTVCSKGEVFDEILPLEELASVSVGGVEFPIPAE